MSEEFYCLHSLAKHLRATNPEEITLKTADGKTVYWPKENMGRLAPAAVVSTVCRIVDLRKFIKNNAGNISADLLKQLEQIARPIDFEDQFLSGNNLKIHNAIIEAAFKENSDIYG